MKDLIERLRECVLGPEDKVVLIPRLQFDAALAALEAQAAEVERLRSRTVTLPPMPEPTQGLGIHRWAYSDDDMRDYAIAALRAAGVEEKT